VTNEDRRQIAGVSRQKMRVLTAKTPQDCWTEVHQIWTRCSLIVTIELLVSGFMIGQSVVECRSKE